MVDYDRVHETWEAAHSLFSPIYELRKSLIFSLLSKIKPAASLDLGCGTGDYTVELLRRGHSVDAVDISAYAIDCLHTKIQPSLWPMLKCYQEKLENFATDKRYDLILLSEVLEHIKDDAGLLRKAASLLTPKGKLIISVPANPYLWTDGDKYSGHLRRYTKQYLISVCRQAGLVPSSLFSYGFPLLKTINYVKKVLIKEKQLLAFTENITGRGHPCLKMMLRSLFMLVVQFDKTFVNMPFEGVGFIAVLHKKEHGK